MMTDDKPRLLTRTQAAEYCGLKPSGFDKWIASGKLPRPLAGTRRWDRKALDLALDQLSGITASAVPSEEDEADRWFRENP